MTAITNTIWNRQVVPVIDFEFMGVKRIIKKAAEILLLSKLFYKTQWYKSLFVDMQHETYPDNTWYRNHEERNFDIVNLGSSSAKYAFDYAETGVKGMNWAQKPQTLLEDFNLLRCYHSILKKGGYVIITIMPFTSINKKTGIYDALKYLKIDTQSEPIQPYLYDKAKKYEKFPILFGKPVLKGLLKYILGKENKNVVDISQCENNPSSDSDLGKDAQRWVDGWKKQFSISDLEQPLTPENAQGREFRIKVMQNLIDFCIEREYVPVYVIPPVTEYLDKYFTTKFKDIYIYEFLQQVGRDVKMLDYTKEKELMDKSFYFNSFFFNKKGCKVFTEKVLKDLGLER